MAKISSLTDNTNQIVYPQTKANAVIMEDSTTVENAIAQRPKMVLSAEEPASTIADNTLYGVYGDVGQITTGEIADSAVTTAKIASSAVTEAKLGTGAVTADKLGSSAVTTAKINSLAVTTAKIANGAVTGVANSATSIGSAKLALNTVGTPNLRDGAVTSDKVDWTTLGASLAYYKKLDSRTTVSGGNYNYKEIVGLTQSVPTVSGATYILISNATGNAPGATDTYIRPYINGTATGGSGIFTPAGGGQWGNVTKIISFTATGSSTTIAIQYGGGTGGNYTMLEGSSWLLLRVG